MTAERKYNLLESVVSKGNSELKDFIEKRTSNPVCVQSLLLMSPHFRHVYFGKIGGVNI